MLGGGQSMATVRPRDWADDRRVSPGDLDAQCFDPPEDPSVAIRLTQAAIVGGLRLARCGARLSEAG